MPTNPSALMPSWAADATTVNLPVPSAGGGATGPGSALPGSALLGASIGTTLAGSLMSGIGALQQGKAVAAAANYNAFSAKLEGDAEEIRLRRLARREISAQYVQMAGKSGVLAEEGGWLEQLANNAREYEINALNAAIKGRNIAALERTRAINARRQGRASMFASVISGVGGAMGTAAMAYGIPKAGR